MQLSHLAGEIRLAVRVALWNVIGSGGNCSANGVAVSTVRGHCMRW
jgi:hypothetical protein